MDINPYELDLLRVEDEANTAELLAIASLGLSAIGAIALVTGANNGQQGIRGPIGATGANGASGSAGTNGTNGTNGATGATGSAGPGCKNNTIFGTGILVSTVADSYLQAEFQASGTILSSLSTREFAPTGSTWRSSIGLDGTLGVGDTLTATIQSSAGLNGVYADTASVASITSADGANPRKNSSTFTAPSNVYLTVTARYTNVVNLSSQSQITLERLT